MAGKPKLRAAFTALDKRGGPDKLQEELLSGKTLKMIANELGLDSGYLRKNIIKHELYGPAIREVEHAIADAHAEAALDLLQQLETRRANERNQADSGNADAETGRVSQVDVALAKGLASQRNFIAAAYNKAKYGTGSQQNVTINIGDMHLDALRKIKVIDHE